MPGPQTLSPARRLQAPQTGRIFASEPFLSMFGNTQVVATANPKSGALTSNWRPAGGDLRHRMKSSLAGAFCRDVSVRRDFVTFCNGGAPPYCRRQAAF
jgi:hypothetical protein